MKKLTRKFHGQINDKIEGKKKFSAAALRRC